MKDGLIISLLSIIPKNTVARCMGFSARIELPTTLQKWLIRYFVWKYKVNIEECVGEIDEFSSLAQFFIRPLKEGRRLIDQEAKHLISPVDGRVHTFGKIVNGNFEQYDAQMGSVAEMLGTTSESPEAQRYQNGDFIIIYLSPQDYHRVHSHTSGTIRKIQYQPGKLWPVFPVATKKIPHLFDRNERLVFHIEEPNARNSSVLSMIGAFGVGRMTTDWHPVITNNHEPQQSTDTAHSIARGQEIGRFELGSTVVLFFEEKQISDWTVKSGEKVTLGQPIAIYSEQYLA